MSDHVGRHVAELEERNLCSQLRHGAFDSLAILLSFTCLIKGVILGPPPPPPQVVLLRASLFKRSKALRCQAPSGCWWSCFPRKGAVILNPKP